MLRVALYRGYPRQDFILSFIGERYHLGHSERSAGEGPCLVEDHCADLASCLHRLGVAHQHPVFRAHGSGDRRHHRDRQAKSVRAGDDQDGDRQG